jgi:hypothetical protein
MPTSERQNRDLAKLILTADQINLHLLQCIAKIDQLICIHKSKLLLSSLGKTSIASSDMS